VGDSSGGYGTILHTTDGGVTWVRQGSPADIPNTNLLEVSAVDAQHAWVVGPGLHGVAPGIIAHTRNAQHWEVQPDPSWPNLNGISFVGAWR